MPSRLRRRSSLPAALLLLVVLEAAALRAGALGQVLVAVVAALALVTVLARASLVRIGLGAALAAAFTISWNGWYVGPVRPGDVLPAVALLLFVVARPDNATRTPPWWVKQLVVALVVVTVLAVLLPIDPTYLAHRLVLSAGGQPVDEKGSPLLANIGVTFKFVVAVLVPPMAFVAAALIDRRAVRWLAIAFTTGTALSGLAATLDHVVHTSVGRLVTGIPNVLGRQTGFTTQPNYLAASVVVAVPLACWLIVGRDRPLPVVGWCCLVALVLGAYASGSRGGAVCVVVAVVVAFAALPRTRASVPGMLLGLLCLAGLITVAAPGFGAAVLRATRLAGNPTTAGSDIVRGLVGAQGVRDFLHSPVFGVGLHVSSEASQVYLQELASGGVILFVAMTVYAFGALATSYRLSAHSDLAAALGAAVLATLALNVFEADLTDRFYYVPQALLVALAAIAPRALPAPTAADDARVPVGAVA